MKRYLYKLLIIISIFIILNSCKKDSDLPNFPKPLNEPEVITALKITLTDSANATNLILVQFKDPDGDGGNQPTIFDTIKLQPNKTYYGKLQLFNDIAGTEITGEVEKEKNDHLFIYKPAIVTATIEITDTDNNTPPLPLGLVTKWRTNVISNGIIQIILKHQPSIKNGTEAPGETDVDLTFPITIKN